MSTPITETMPRTAAGTVRDRVVFERQESGMVLGKVYFNDYQVYEIIATTMGEALAKSVRTVNRLMSFPVPIFGRIEAEALIGRKIYYREIPAVIQDFNGMTGKVTIRPDNPEKVFPPEPWDVDPTDEQANVVWNGAVREDLLSPKIWWFRSTQGE